MKLIGPNSIFFLPYLLSAFLISLLWLKQKSKKKWSEVFHIYFSKEVWGTHSCFTDIKLTILTILLLNFVIHPFEVWIFDHNLIYLTNKLINHSGVSWNYKVSNWQEGILATLVTMISIDGASYFVHRAMHRFLWLKKIHYVHHSALQLTFFTTHRQHPIEPLILNSVRSFSAALGLSLFHWFFPMQTPVITILGVGAGFFLYMFTVNLHHSHIPVNYPSIVKQILISPHIHHLHHSKNPIHFGKNYGVVFSFWDRLFKTYHDEEVNLNELKFGLPTTSTT